MGRYRCSISQKIFIFLPGHNSDFPLKQRKQKQKPGRIDTGKTHNFFPVIKEFFKSKGRGNQPASMMRQFFDETSSACIFLKKGKEDVGINNEQRRKHGSHSRSQSMSLRGLLFEFTAQLDSHRIGHFAALQQFIRHLEH